MKLYEADIDDCVTMFVNDNINPTHFSETPTPHIIKAVIIDKRSNKNSKNSKDSSDVFVEIGWEYVKDIPTFIDNIYRTGFTSSLHGTYEIHSKEPGIKRYC